MAHTGRGGGVHLGSIARSGSPCRVSRCPHPSRSTCRSRPFHLLCPSRCKRSFEHELAEPARSRAGGTAERRRMARQRRRRAHPAWPGQHLAPAMRTVECAGVGLPRGSGNASSPIYIRGGRLRPSGPTSQARTVETSFEAGDTVTPRAPAVTETIYVHRRNKLTSNVLEIPHQQRVARLCDKQSGAGEACCLGRWLPRKSTSL